jgi:pyruvate/2-oxoglutarate dehydrogenase complex dihydrolipoamide dehydrogenase (E3) component
VVLATGSIPTAPPVEGIDNPMVVPFTGAFDQTLDNRKNTVVVGGGATGCEVALHLAQNGCAAIIVEMLPKIGTNLESITRKVLLKELHENEVTIMTECRLLRIEERGVTLVDKDGQEKTLEVDCVVIAVGTRPDVGLFDRVKSLGYEVHRIGDCLEPRSAKAAIFEGAVLGRSI